MNSFNGLTDDAKIRTLKKNDAKKFTDKGKRFRKRKKGKKRKSEDLNKTKSEEHLPPNKKTKFDSKRTEKPTKEPNTTHNSDSQSNDNHKEINSFDNSALESIGYEWDATPEDLAEAIHRRTENYKDDRHQDFDEKNLQTPEHFECLAPEQSNNSKFWIKYISHHLEATEVDKARAVAKRAIQEIDSAFEADRLSVWLSLLNIEYLHSTPEIFKETLSEALKCNKNEQKIYEKVLDLYSASKNTTELENLADTLEGKYGKKISYWIVCQSALMKAELLEKARFFLMRSLKVLPVKHHCAIVSRFALLENEYGSPEKATGLFDAMLATYPKRADLWYLYADMYIKSGCFKEARMVFQLATHNVPRKKIKALHKKWNKFEKEYGNQERLQQAEAAKDYVDPLTALIQRCLNRANQD